MKKALLAVLVLVLFSALSLAQDGKLLVPGKRIVVIHPGDVVVQAADLPTVARFRFDVSSSGKVTVTNGTPRPARKPGEVRMLDEVNSYVTDVWGECYEDAAQEIPCADSGNPSQRYLLVQGTYLKFDPIPGHSNECSWTLGDFRSPSTGWSNSTNVTGTSLETRYYTEDCGSGVPCWLGDPSSAWYKAGGLFGILIRVDLEPVSNFVIWVDFTGGFSPNLCPLY
jgi:hypothetical protein